MPCSALFQGYIRTMSVGPTTSLAILRTHNTTTTKTLKPTPSLLWGFLLRKRNQSHHYYSSRANGFFNFSRHVGRREVKCLASSGTIEVDWRLRRRSATAPFLQQSLNYGRYAYQDATTSDDSDLDIGVSRQQMVSFLVVLEFWIIEFGLFFFFFF